MARFSGVKHAFVSALSGSDRPTMRRWLFIWMALVGLGWFGLIPISGCTNMVQQDASSTAPVLGPDGNPIPPPPKGDPSGSNTGSAGDAADAGATTFVPAEPKEPAKADFKTDKDFKVALAKYKDAKADFHDYGKQSNCQSLAVKLGNSVGHNRVAINMMWTLITGFLVMFMQAGFALVETGLTRAKNASHTMMMNFMVYGLGLFAYWVCGFAIQMGGSAGISSLGGCAPLNGEYTMTLFGKPW